MCQSGVSVNSERGIGHTGGEMRHRIDRQVHVGSSVIALYKTRLPWLRESWTKTQSSPFTSLSKFQPLTSAVLGSN